MINTKIIMTTINVFASRLRWGVGCICMTSNMVEKLNKPPQKFVEVDSLIKHMREVNNYYFEDDFVEKSGIDEFICIIEGNIKEEANPDLLEKI